MATPGRHARQWIARLGLLGVLSAVSGFAVAATLGTRDGSQPEVVLRTALAETFATVNGIAIAEAGGLRFVALVGTNDLERDSTHELRLFEVDSDGRGVALAAPFPHLANTSAVQAVALGDQWCVGGVVRGRFVGACRAVDATTHTLWRLMPEVPAGPEATYDLVAAGGVLYVMVTTVERIRSRTRAYRLADGGWRRTGGEIAGRGSIVSASAIGGRPVLTILQPVRPAVRALSLGADGRWRSMVGRRTARSLARVGHSPLLGTPQRIGQHLTLGLSRPTRHGFRFGVASLRDGGFTAAPVTTYGQAQGAVFGQGSGWAIWKEALPGKHRTLRGPIRAARLSRHRSSWKDALRRARTLFDGTWISANIEVTRQDGHYYAVHPVFTGRSIAYRMTRLE